MIRLTLYTPSYNRCTYLQRQYESLCRQTDKNFIWQIIDDGSTDNTRETVARWMEKDNGFEIRYHYKENQGVHTARDAAYRLCDTELIVGIDSDDIVYPKAIERLNAYWKENASDRYAGIIAELAFENKTVVCELPKKREVSYQELLFRYNCRGDTLLCLCAEEMKKISDAPVFLGEKLVGESYKWMQLPNDKPFLLLKESLFIHNYLEDGYSKNVARNRFRNPRGFRAEARQHIISGQYAKARIRGQIKYIAYSILLKDKEFLKDSPKRLQTVILLPLGVAAYIYMMVRWGKYRET